MTEGQYYEYAQELTEYKNEDINLPTSVFNRHIGLVDRQAQEKPSGSKFSSRKQHSLVSHQ